MNETSGRLVCTVAPVEAILRLAVRYPVFPCRRYAEEIIGADGQTKLCKPKSPLTRRGFLDASQDLDQIRAWWGRNPDALVGVPTGKATGLVVVDYDAGKVDASANEWVQEHVDELMSTRVHGTLSGGRHYLYRAPADVEYRSTTAAHLDGKKRQGIDLRAEGGYIIWWPMHGGSTVGDLAPLPAGLIDDQRIDVRDLPPLPAATPEHWAKEREQVARALAYLDMTDYSEWMRAGLAIHLASGGCEDGFNLWHAWSAGELTGDTPRNYSGPNDCRYHWSSYRHDRDRAGLVTIASLFEKAKSHGYVHGAPRPELPPLEAYDDEAQLEREAIRAESAATAWPEEARPEEPSTAAAAARKPLDWEDLATKGVPPMREWAIYQWFGMGHVTLLAGGPGTGKTTVAQAIGSCIALGRDFLDETIKPRRVLMWASEDDEQELWRRQIAIAKWMNVPLDAFAGEFILHSYDGDQVELAASVDQRRLSPTAMYQELCQQIGDYKADVVILDNIARLFAGNENDRHQVTSFVALLTAAAKPTQGAIMLLGHPSKGAGSEYSGSTAWEGSVRARLYLGRTLPDLDGSGKSDEQEEDESTRFLCRRKANYSPRDWRRLEYQDGVMVPAEGRSGPYVGPEYARDVVVRAVRKLADLGEHGNTSRSTSAYLPKLAKQYDLLEGISERQFELAMVDLRKEVLLVIKTVGQYANRSPRKGIALADQ